MDLKFDIKEHIGDFGESSKGWTKELNLVSWNGMAPKYDIRAWNPDHSQMGKGFTMTEEELMNLRDLLDGLDL